MSDKLQTELDKLQGELEKYMEAAIDLRFQFQVPNFSSGPVELNSSLVQVQEVLTSLERILSDSVRAKAALDRKTSHAKMVWQEAWDTAMSAEGKKPKFGDFTTGKEKSAEANLAAFNEARILRRLEETQSFANEAVDIARLHYYGLDKVRQDIRKRLDMSQTDYYS